MRIPRNLEWRAGVALVGAATVLLGLLISLTLARTDVGVEVEGVISRTQAGWTLTAETPGERLNLVRQCQSVRIRIGDGRAWYGRVAGISGQLTPKGTGVLTQIEVREDDAPYPPADSPQRVRVMLLKARGVPVLSVLLDSILNRQRG